MNIDKLQKIKDRAFGKIVMPEREEPVVNYRQGIVPYSDLPTRKPAVVKEQTPSPTRDFSTGVKEGFEETTKSLFDTIGKFIPSLQSGLGYAVGKAGKGIGTAVGAVTGATAEKTRQDIEMLRGKRDFGDLDKQRIVEQAKISARETGALGEEVGRGGMDITPVALTAPIAIDAFLIYATGKNVYDAFKEAGKETTKLKTTDTALKELGKKGWESWGFPKELSDKIADNPLYISSGLAINALMAYAGSRGLSNKFVNRLVKNGNIIDVKQTDITSQEMQNILRENKIESPALQQGTFRITKIAPTTKGKLLQPVSLVGKTKVKIEFRPSRVLEEPKATREPVKQLTTGISERPVVTPTTSGQVGFQIINTKKQANLVKAKKVLQDALEVKRGIVTSGKASAKVKADFEEINNSINIINNKIASLEKEQIEISGPVLTETQKQASVVKEPEVAPITREATVKPIQARQVVKAEQIVSKEESLLEAKQTLQKAKGLSADDIMNKYPDINLKRDVKITNIHGDKSIIEAGEALTPYEIKGNKVLLQDGKTYIVSKNQYQNIRGQSVNAEAVEFVPELKGVKVHINSKRDLKFGKYTIPHGKNNKELVFSLSPDSGNIVNIIDLNEKVIWEKPVLSGNRLFNLYKSKNFPIVIQEHLESLNNVYVVLDSGFIDEYSIAESQYTGGIFNKNFYLVDKAKEEVEKFIKKDRAKKIFIDPTKKFHSHSFTQLNNYGWLRLNERDFKGDKIHKAGSVTFLEEIQHVNPRTDNISPEQFKKLPDFAKGNKFYLVHLKSALLEAVKNNSDYFAWISGKQTNDRYNLDTYLDEVIWKQAFAKQGKDIELQTKTGEKIQVVVDKETGIIASHQGGANDWGGKKLDEVLGKGLADKIMAKESGTLSGEGLKFGGEWASNLYDKQLKNIVEDLTGGKVFDLDMGLISGDSKPDYVNKEYTDIRNEKDVKVSDILFEHGHIYGVTKIKDGYVYLKHIEDIEHKKTPTFEDTGKMELSKIVVRNEDGWFSLANHFKFINGEMVNTNAKKSKSQQAIELTPFIKRIILSEAPDIKKPSGRSPVAVVKPGNYDIEILEKPLSRRKAAVVKREVRITEKAKKEAKAKELEEIVQKEQAIRARKPKSYKEYLAKAEAKKPVRKIETPKVKDKITSVREYMLEQKVKQGLKSGDMTEAQASKIRASGKYNIQKNEIEFGKQRISIDDAESMTKMKSDEEFKLFEHGYRLVKKYTKLVGKTEGVVSEKNVPRGAIASASKSGTTRFKSLNSINAVVHEITHIIDTASDLRGKITDGDVIAELKDIYKKYYLAKPKLKNVDTNKAIIEGFATFIERYSLFPSKTKGDYPTLVKEFLKEDGLYYNPLFNELINDTQSVLKQYQGLDALGKVMSRVTDNSRNIDVKSFYNVRDKIKSYLFNVGWALEKLGQYTGIERTPNDPYLWYETYRLWNQVFNHNVTARKGMFSRETYLTVDNMGNFIETHNFNWGTIIKSLGTDSSVSKYGGYLLSRDTHFSYIELKDLKIDIAKNKEVINDLEEKNLLEQSPLISLKIKELKDLNKELNSYATQKQKVLETRNIPEKEATEAYDLNKEKYIEQDKMYDALIKSNLDTIHLSRLIDPKMYSYLISKKGYAPTYVDYIDEIAGVPELSDSVLDNISYTMRGKNISSLIFRKGSEKPIKNPLMQAIVNEGKNTPKAIQQIIYNKFGEITTELPDYVVNEVEYSPLMKDRNNTIITIDESFKKHAYKVDKNLKKLFDTAFTPKTMGIFRKFVVKSSKLFTVSTTGIYSAFAIVNVPIDAMSSFIQSKNRLIPIIDSFRKSIDLLKKDPATKKYVHEYFNVMGFRNTAIGSIYYAETLSDSLRVINTKYKKSVRGQVSTSFDDVVDVLSFPSQATEIMTRLTEYVRSREEGNSQIVAREDSVRVSAPFVHRGYIYPIIQPAVYVNAGLQVMDMTLNTMNRMWREMRGTKSTKDKTKVIKRFSYLTIGLAAIALAEIGILLKKLEDASTDEEKKEALRGITDYNNLSMYERTNFTRSSIWSDKPGLIRIPSNYAIIPNLITMIAADKYLKSNFTAAEYAELFVESLTVPHSFFAYLPYFPKETVLISLGMKDFPEIKKLEQDYMKNMPPEERIYATTSGLAKWIGNTEVVKSFNKVLSPVWQVSPIKIQEYMNMFGRGIFKQFTGEWDPDKNVFTNILNSYFATIKNTLVKKDYLFVGREFEKFYADKGEIDYEISSGKKIYKVVGDKTLAKDVSVSMKRSRLYNQVSDYMTSIRKIDSAKIDVPREYVNNIYNIIDNLNRNEDKKALKSLLDLSASYDFNNFINNAKRKIEEERRKKVKEDYENKSTD